MVRKRRTTSFLCNNVFVRKCLIILKMGFILKLTFFRRVYIYQNLYYLKPLKFNQIAKQTILTIKSVHCILMIAVIFWHISKLNYSKISLRCYSKYTIPALIFTCCVEKAPQPSLIYFQLIFVTEIFSDLKVKTKTSSNQKNVQYDFWISSLTTSHLRLNVLYIKNWVLLWS